MTAILEEDVTGTTAEEMKDQVNRHVASLVSALVKRKVEADLNLAAKEVSKMNISATVAESHAAGFCSREKPVKSAAKRSKSFKKARKEGLDAEDVNPKVPSLKNIVTKAKILLESLARFNLNH